MSEVHAIQAALDDAAKDADALVACLQKNYQAVTQGYLSKLLAQTARGDGFAAALAEMCHLRQEMIGDRGHHSANFAKMTQRVCRAHGFDIKIF